MELKLNWQVRRFKRPNGKIVEVRYIHIPSDIARLLSEYDPYLDIEQKLIIFRKREKNEHGE